LWLGFRVRISFEVWGYGLRLGQRRRFSQWGLARRCCKTRPERLKSEAGWAESRDGVGFLGRGRKPPPHQQGLEECCKLAHWGPGEATGNVVLVHFRASQFK